MKRLIKLAILTLITGVFFISCNQTQQSEKSQEITKSVFPSLQGPYLGQKLPGTKAEMFAYELLYAGNMEGYIRFSPDGKEFIYGVVAPNGILLVEPKGVFGKGYAMYSRLENEFWSEPREFVYNCGYRFGYPSFSPDGNRIVFNSYGPGGSEENNPQSRTWYIDRTSEGWSEPKEIILGKNYDGPGTVHPSIAENGNLYFAQFYDGEHGYLYVSKYENGAYSSPELLSDAINDIGGNHPYIAPDESFIIYDSERPDDTYGTSDLYISFRDEKGEWMKPQNLGEGVNSQYDERRPFLTSDRKYLFFASDRINPERPDHPLTITELRELTDVPADSQQHIYWVDAKVIDELKLNNLE